MEQELVICDSNIFIDILRSIDKTISEVEEIGYENIVVTSITIVEILAGVKNKEDYNRTIKQLDKVNVIHFNDDISRLVERYSKDFALKHKLQIPDLIIGCSALFFDLKLFTYNKKDFKFLPGIKLY